MFRMLFPDLLKSRSKWEKQLFRDYKEMLDYNFSYLQEVVAVFQQYKEVARCKGWRVRKKYYFLFFTLSSFTEWKYRSYSRLQIDFVFYIRIRFRNLNSSRNQYSHFKFSDLLKRRSEKERVLIQCEKVRE